MEQANTIYDFQNFTRLWDYLNYHKLTPQQLTSLTAKPDSDKAIFRVDIEELAGRTYVKLNYDQINCPPALLISQQARGIIFEYQPEASQPYQIVCYPFNRFFNWNQTGLVAPLDWATTQIQEKVDGSIVMAWWCPATEQWEFSTRGKIRTTEPFTSEIARLRAAHKFGEKHFQKGYTYIFELYTFATAVCIQYPGDRIVHLGTRSLQAPDYPEVDIKLPGLDRPTLYQFDDYQKVCRDNTMGIEGYVLVDATWNRQKIKTATYLAMNRATHVWSKGQAELVRLYVTGQFDNLLRDHDIPILQHRHAKVKQAVEAWIAEHRTILASYQDRPVKQLLRDKSFPSYLKKYISRLETLPQEPASVRQLLLTVIEGLNPKTRAAILDKYEL